MHIQEDHVIEAIKSIRKIATLGKSPLLDTCLVAELRSMDENSTEMEALQFLLEECRQATSTEKEEFPIVLQRRFWDDISPPIVANELHINTRTIYEWQKQALKSAATLFLDREKACWDRREISAVELQDSERRLRRVPLRQYVVGLIVIVGISIWVINTLRSLAEEIVPDAPTTISVELITATVESVPALAATDESPPGLYASVCGESELVPDISNPERFNRYVGVSVFRKDTTDGQIVENRVRALFGLGKRLFIGYHALEGEAVNGITLLDHQGGWYWGDCLNADILNNKRVNSIYFFEDGTGIVATDGNGLLIYEDGAWSQVMTATDGTRFFTAYDFAVDDDGFFWVGTDKGVLKRDDTGWLLVYDDSNGLPEDFVHEIVFDEGYTWFGHVIRSGITRLNLLTSAWDRFTLENGLGGEQIRDMVLIKREEDVFPEIWVATEDGGLSRYYQGAWSNFNEANGFPSNQVRALAVDAYNRVWAGTYNGAYYLQDGIWHQYHPYSTLAIAFTMECQDGSCRQDDNVWTGTEENGLTHSRLPPFKTAVRVVDICFQINGGIEDCGPPTESSGYVERRLSLPLMPGDEVVFLITVMPLNGVDLLEARGDFLSFTSPIEHLYGAYDRIPVLGTIISDQTLTLSNANDPITIPEAALDAGIDETTIVSDWRIWRYTRYIGPTIRLLIDFGQ